MRNTKGKLCLPSLQVLRKNFHRKLKIKKCFDILNCHTIKLNKIAMNTFQKIMLFHFVLKSIIILIDQNGVVF